MKTKRQIRGRENDFFLIIRNTKKKKEIMLNGMAIMIENSTAAKKESAGLPYSITYGAMNSKVSKVNNNTLLNTKPPQKRNFVTLWFMHCEM